jgi:hypothetical protein
LDAVDAKEGASKTIGTTAPAATATAPLSAADFERAVNSRIDKLSNSIVRQLLRDNGIDFRTGNEKERLRELKPVEKAILANQVLDEDLQIEIPGTFDPARPSITASVQPKREEAAAIPANVRLMDSVRRGNSSGTILQGIAQDKDVPQPLRNLARSMLRVAPNITVPVIERRYEEPDVVGEYVHPQNGDEAIYLDPRSESSAQTFLHEFVHPMTVNAIARGTPEGKRVVQLFEQYKAQHPESSAYGFTNPYEFVAEGITNPNFQSTLKRQNWWGRFVDAIRRIIGLPASQSGTVE